MRQINCFNVIRMLFDEYDESLKFTSEITQEEIDLKEHIFGMLFINQNKLINFFFL